jgi:type VI secretion system protein ImpJ
MFLQPQHFQHAERYFSHSMHAKLGAYFPYCYGIIEAAIDTDAIANDQFSLNSCTGVLPDGTYFSVPREDRTPPARSFTEHFTPEQQQLDVFLALPRISEGKANVSMGGADLPTPTRYYSAPHEMVDEVLGIQKKEIDLGINNFIILFADESLDNYVTLPIARLVRTSSGQVAVQEQFVPPLLRIGASSFLMGQIRNVLEVLLARITSLSQGRRQVEGGFAQFASSEETAFRLLQTLNTFTPQLNHSHYIGSVHPYDLFNLLTQLTGALCTFSAEVSIQQLPRYDHTNLTASLTSLIHMIKSILNADIGAGSVSVPIEQLNEATYWCKIPDERLLKSAKFFLGISADIPEKELIVGALQRIKMCSRDKLDLLISTAMPGLQLIHTSRPPESLSTKPKFIYFSLNQQGDLWNGILASGSIAFYFPNNYKNLKLEMLALKGA